MSRELRRIYGVQWALTRPSATLSHRERESDASARRLRGGSGAGCGGGAAGWAAEPSADLLDQDEAGAGGGAVSGGVAGRRGDFVRAAGPGAAAGRRGRADAAGDWAGPA